MANGQGGARVVVGVDGSPGARNAAQHAAELAGMRRAELVIAHAYQLVEEVPPRGVDLYTDLRDAAHRMVEELAAGLRLPAGVSVRTVVELTTPSQLLSAAGGESGLVVLGQHPSGWLEHLVMGNTTAAIVKHVPCPVVVVPETWRLADGAGRPVIVALDGRSAARPATAFAAQEASLRQAELVALHAVPSAATERELADERQLLAEVLAASRRNFPDLPISELLVPGDPDDVVAERTELAALMVVSKPHHRWPGAWGRSVARAVITRSACPLAIVPPDRSDG